MVSIVLTYTKRYIMIFIPNGINIKRNKMKNNFNTEIIEEYIIKNSLSKKQFCKLCKIDYCVLDKILDGNANFKIHYLFKIAEKINIEIYELFKE